uniref:Hyposin-H6 n=1 Tax=Pithecopus hypochondrialis TaxID=317381 RepID=HPS6_PITHY|nr:RecName: Full=Hyposin-H6; Short=HPS-H6; AltName: Full=Hyposin HA-6 [Pithecopus hypochondrialis]
LRPAILVRVKGKGL